jgi:transcriptional regulator with PAS, ATPase and Fis domain
METADIVYVSEEMAGVIRTSRQIARTCAPVLIEGESGTGKELIARLIHRSSPRSSRAFVPVNCGAIPESIFESEFFGYRAGSFTGALKDKTGIFEAAQGGTAFLDEIGDLSLAMQAKILRVLQEKELRRVGDTRPSRIDIRVIAATNKDIEHEMSSGRFREDLFFRIGVLRIRLAPLRQRRADIPVLVNHFAEKYARLMGKHVPCLNEDVLDVFERYRWPGNVRELENEIHRIVALVADGRPVCRLQISGRITEGLRREEAVQGDGRLKKRLAFYEKQLIKEALDLYDWNKTRAARHLGLTRQGLHRKIARLSITKDEWS